MSEEKMRTEFEEWASTHFFLQEEDEIIDDSDEYISGDMQLAWDAWQASRAALEIEMPSNLTEGDDYAEGWNHALVLASGSLAIAGVRVKQ